MISDKTFNQTWVLTLAAADGRSNGIRCLILGGSWVKTSVFNLLIIMLLNSWWSSLRFDAPLQSHWGLLPKYLLVWRKKNVAKLDARVRKQFIQYVLPFKIRSDDTVFSFITECKSVSKNSTLEIVMNKIIHYCQL